MSRILIVDDTADIRETIKQALSAYDIVECENGQQAIDKLQIESFDLVVLDVVMPEVDGYGVCNWMQSHGNATPILMLSSKDSDMDKAIGLNLGADDYLAKPFSPIELQARVKARLRKKEALHKPAQINLKSARLDQNQRRFWIGEEEINLSATEFEIMELFLAQPDRVFTRDFLLDYLKGRDFPCQPHAIDNHVYRLRLKLKPIPSNPIQLETVRAVGYRLTLT